MLLFNMNKHFKPRANIYFTYTGNMHSEVGEWALKASNHKPETSEQASYLLHPMLKLLCLFFLLCLSRKNISVRQKDEMSMGINPL